MKVPFRPERRIFLPFFFFERCEKAEGLKTLLSILLYVVLSGRSKYGRRVWNTQNEPVGFIMSLSVRLDVTTRQNFRVFRQYH